VPKIT